MAQEWAKRFYHSKEWKAVRDYCMKRDNYLCTVCGKPAQEVHHINKLTQTNITDMTVALNPSNLVSLCRDCHFNEHKRDKLNGTKNKHGSHDCGNEYFFDENGELQKRDAENTAPRKNSE